MKIQSLEKQQKYILLTISLLAHTLLLVLLFSTRLDTEPKLLLDEQNKPLFKNQAALIPGRSRFGAPVVFQELPELPAEQMTAEQQQKPIEPQQEIEKVEEKLQVTVDKLLATKMITARKRAEQKAKEQAQKMAEAQRKIIPPQPKKETAQDEREKQLTIADISRGFLDTIDKGGQDMLERAGDASIRPDLEEMKYIRYVEKVGWCIQQAYKVDPSPPLLRFDGAVDLLVRMVIDRQGHLLELKLLKSTGHPDLDNFLLRGIKSASPYPPVPDYFNTDKFTLPAASIRTYGKSQSGFGVHIS